MSMGFKVEILFRKVNFIFGERECSRWAGICIKSWLPASKSTNTSPFPDIFGDVT